MHLALELSIQLLKYLVRLWLATTFVVLGDV
jgi:hypothetical protein